MIDQEKGDGTDTSDRQSRLYERPDGLRGLYANPVTQARSLLFVFPSNIYSFIKVTLLGFVCFMCPGTVTTFHDDC